MLAETEEAQIYILRSLFDLWSTHQQVSNKFFLYIANYNLF